MTVKSSSPSKTFRALVTVEFTAPDRATAIKRAKEMFDTPNSTVRVQESTTAWLSITDPEVTAPTS
jgi:hypothetical protein